MNFKLRLIALLLLTMIMLSSCSLSLESVMQQLPEIPFLESLLGSGSEQTTPPDSTESTTLTGSTGPVEPPKVPWRVENSSSIKDMLERYTLTREEADATLALLDEIVAGALPDPEGDPNVATLTIEEVDALYLQFEEAFYHTAQQMTIASIIYYYDMSDEESKNRHLDTQEMFYDIQDKYTESCRTMYLSSPYASEFFDGWSEEEIQSLLDFDPTTTALKKEIEELQVQYNSLSNNAFTDGSAEIYAQIVTKGNQLARLYGYDNYYEYASKNVYGRDYSTEDLQKFQDYVVEYVVPRYSKLKKWEEIYNLSSSRRDLAISFLSDSFDSSNMNKNYLLLYLDSLGDTTMGVAMRDVFDSKNCIFSSESQSHPTAFCTYMYEDETPFCLFGSSGQTVNTMVHEIGHYYASYVNNDLNNYDLCETHSQANEYLFLQYCKGEINSKVYEVVRYYNLFNSYYIILCATIIDDFEQRVYSLDSVEGFTSADFDAIMTEVIADYGKTPEWFATNITDMYSYWRKVAIDNPVYYISYAVSSIAAVEIFAIAESTAENEGYEAAQQIYIGLVEGVTEEDGFCEALKKVGLYTPFEEEAFQKVAATMRK